MAILTCRELSLGYEGKPILEHLNFSVADNDYLCIVGENGSGKSTLMRTLLGLQTPIDGNLEWGKEMSPKQIGYLPQQTVVQRDFPATVQEIVRSGCLGKRGLRPYYSVQEKKLAQEMMQRVGIVGLAKHCYRELSGGQQQRVLLARALCATGRLLLLDEPVTGLDPKATQELYDCLQGLHDGGIGVIMITHDVSVALRYAEHILHLGKQVFFGTRDDYLQSAPGTAFFAQGGEPQ
mgnify:CR=1 FL=1